jgi:NAD(P)H-flavin reductase/ferredoxin
MAKLIGITVNMDTFTARPGDLLLDAAIMHGVEIPHDCRSGHCGTCLVRQIEGRTLGGRSRQRGMVHACQVRLFSNSRFFVEKRPPVRTIGARLSDMRPLAADVMELKITPAEPLEHLPGQYYRFQFRGFPARAFSPTVPLEGRVDANAIRLHVKRVPGGRVSSRLGSSIKRGHGLTMEGPFGSAYFRTGLSSRLVLVAGGTGFAPIWAIACAALRERIERRIILVAGAPALRSLYMAPALCRVASLPNVTVMPTAEEHQALTNMVRWGRPTDHVPPLMPGDVVYAAGAPAMVATMATSAERAGVPFFADAFVANPPDSVGLLTKLLAWRKSTPKLPRVRTIPRRTVSGQNGAPLSGSIKPQYGSIVSH